MIIGIDSRGKRSRQRVLLLGALRNAVRRQIELWDSIQTLEELIEVDFDPLLWVETTSRLFRSGGDVSMAHVKDYLDRGPIYIDSGPRSVRLAELLLKALTRAVDLQIKFWNVLEQLKRLSTVEFDPARWVSTTCMIVDGGGDLTMADVDNYLGTSA